MTGSAGTHSCSPGVESTAIAPCPPQVTADVAAGGYQSIAIVLATALTGTDQTAGANKTRLA